MEIWLKKEGGQGIQKLYAREEHKVSVSSAFLNCRGGDNKANGGNWKRVQGKLEKCKKKFWWEAVGFGSHGKSLDAQGKEAKISEIIYTPCCKPGVPLSVKDNEGGKIFELANRQKGPKTQIIRIRGCFRCIRGDPGDRRK